MRPVYGALMGLSVVLTLLGVLMCILLINVALLLPEAMAEYAARRICIREWPPLICEGRYEPTQKGCLSAGTQQKER